jgi:excisionase family DNA binding protein
MYFNQSEKLDKILEHISITQSQKWMNLNDVCIYTRLGKSTIHRAIQKGELRVSKATGKLLFRKAWIDKFLES